MYVNGKTIINLQDIANKFNEFFINIGTDLGKRIPAVDGSHRDYMTASDASMFVLLTNALEIIDIARNLKPSKSPGYDEISLKVIKSIINNIAQPLSVIFNLSLKTGIFPDKLKTAKLSPIFKSDNKRLVNNYRLSILPVFSKILGKLMYNILLSYLDKINILTDKQYGFREKYSTYMAIINLVDRMSLIRNILRLSYLFTSPKRLIRLIIQYF